MFKPVIVFNVLQSIQLLADAMRSFDRNCVVGLQPDRERIADLVKRSLMLVTALTPYIGYDAATEIAKSAHKSGATLKEAALASGKVSEADFDHWVDAAAMAQMQRDQKRQD